jgi:hypothetical protein
MVSLLVDLKILVTVLLLSKHRNIRGPWFLAATAQH